MSPMAGASDEGGFDVVIDAGFVVTMDPSRRILREGMVGIRGDSVAFIGHSTDPAGDRPAARVIRAPDAILLPGLVDAHVHHCQMLARGLADDVDLLTWCFDVVYPLEALLDEEATRVGALLCCAEMIRTGTTCAIDPGGYQMDAVGDALVESGLRGMLAWAGTDVSNEERRLPPRFPGALTTEETMEREEDVVKRWHGAAEGRIRASYSIRTDVNGSVGLAARLKEAAERDDTLVQMHALVTTEQRAYLEYHPELAGIHRLAEADLLGSRWFLIHFGAVGDREVELVLEHDVAVCHAPGSSAHGGYGACTRGRFPELIRDGARVALGCDSSSANNSLDMVRAMYQAATNHKEVREDPTAVAPEEALTLATLGGARAVGWDDEIGSIEVGKKADVIVVDTSQPWWRPMHDFSLIPTLVYSGNGLDVQTVLVDGRILMEDGRILSIPVDDVVSEAQAIAERLVQDHPARGRWQPRWPIS